MKTAGDLQLGDTIYSCYFNKTYGTFHLNTHVVTRIENSTASIIKVTVDHYEIVEFTLNSTYVQNYGRAYLISKEGVSAFLNSAIKEMGKNIESMLNYAQALELGDLNESDADWEKDHDDRDLLEFITSAFILNGN